MPEIYNTAEVIGAMERFAAYYLQKKGDIFDAFMRQATFEGAMRDGWSAEKLCECIGTSIKRGWFSIYEERQPPAVAGGRKSREFSKTEFDR